MNTSRVKSADLIAAVVHVRYPDGSPLKSQTWKRRFLQETQRISFFGPAITNEEADLLHSRRDWRLTPCMVRYLRNGNEPMTICEKGRSRIGDTQWRSRWHHRGKRGVPSLLILDFKASTGAATLTLDEAQLRDIRGIEFRVGLDSGGVSTITPWFHNLNDQFTEACPRSAPAASESVFPSDPRPCGLNPLTLIISA
jgi:hypothetical protein